MDEATFKALYLQNPVVDPPAVYFVWDHNEKDNLIKQKGWSRDMYTYVAELEKLYGMKPIKYGGHGGGKTLNTIINIQKIPEAILRSRGWI